MILGGTLNIFQFSSLYNPVDVKSEVTCTEDVADGCYTEVRNALPHKHICGREFPISFKFGHIILPV